LSRKAIHNWVKKFSQGRSIVADDAWPSSPVEIACETVTNLVLLYNRQHNKFIINKPVLLYLYSFIMYIYYMFWSSWIIIRQYSLNVLLVLNCISNVNPYQWSLVGRPTSEKIHMQGARTWTPQKENYVDQWVSFSDKHILVWTTICGSIEIYWLNDLVQCDGFQKVNSCLKMAK
jgi:hypothetical protein